MSDVRVRKFHHRDPGFARAVAQHRTRGEQDLDRVQPVVAEIGQSVRTRGDAALIELTERFEQRALSHVVMPPDIIAEQASRLDPKMRSHLAHAAERIREFHEHQRDAGFRYERDGILLGTRVRPVRAAGIYAPGGKARYPSTVLMSAIPAAVAGVERIVLATPAPTPELFAAAQLAGVHEVIDLGGAQAVFALAYGTESVRPVDKIAGPGNIYVACAKRMVFGTVDIDQIAGPSEILVLADASADPRIVAADLLSQAEHDEDAYPLLVTTEASLVDEVERALAVQLESLPKRSIAEASLSGRAAAFIAADREQAIRVADTLASEHLSLQVENAESVAEHICAGAIFIGGMTPEAAGDYAAGPSHTLPTGGAARFGSPLGVYDFVVRSSLIRYSTEALATQAPLLTALARLEGLEAHARAVEIRLEPPRKE